MRVTDLFVCLCIYIPDDDLVEVEIQKGRDVRDKTVIVQFVGLNDCTVGVIHNFLVGLRKPTKILSPERESV